LDTCICKANLFAEGNEIMATYLSNVKVIGYEVKAELTETVIPSDMVKEAARNAGLPDALVPEKSTKSALIRAAKAVSKTLKDGRQSKTGRFNDHLARKVLDNGIRTVVGIVDESRDEANEILGYEQTTTIRLNKESGQVEAEGSKAAEFKEEFDLYSVGLTSGDIRSYIYRIIRREGKGIALIPTGGLYFVPEPQVEVIERLNKFTTALSIGRVWYDCKVESENALEWVWDSAKRTVKQQLTDILRSVAKPSKTVRGLEGRKKDLAEAEALVKAYSEITGFGEQFEELLEEINDAANLIANRIGEVEAAKGKK